MNEFSLDSLKLSDLLQNVDNGELKLPSFQRSYKWKPTQVKKLLDSIQRQHPAGSLLFWQVNPRNKLVVDEPFKYTDVEDEVIADYLVLDGQQRLTSCYCAFYNKGTKSYFFDLQKLYNETRSVNQHEIEFEALIVVKRNTPHPDQFLFSHHLLPLSFLKSKDVLRENLKAYKQNLRASGHNEGYLDFLDAKLEGFLDPFFDYRFPTIVLPKKLTLDAVCKVFQSINTTGLKLSAFDICVARFMAYGINLKEKIKVAKDEFEKLNPLLSYDETVVLQTIALLAGKTPKKNSLADNLSQADLSYWDKAISGLNQTITLLTRFGVGCDDNLTLLPYHPTIPVMAAVLADRDYANLRFQDTHNINDKIKKWFFTVALITRYTEGTDNKMKEDFSVLRTWILSGVEPDYIQTPIRWNPDEITKANKSGAIGKAVLCVFNLSKPEDFYTNSQVGIGSNVGSSQLHHVFPNARYSFQYRESLNSVFNFAFLTPESNNFIKDKRTNEYLDEIISRRGVSESVLKGSLNKHFIDEKTYQFMKCQDYMSFLKARSEAVYKYLRDNIGINIVIDTTEIHEAQDIDDEFDLTMED